MSKPKQARRGEGRVLDPVRVVRTFDQLQARVHERFPTSGLAKVCDDLAQVARETASRARRLSRPYYGLRLLAALTVINRVNAALAEHAVHEEERLAQRAKAPPDAAPRAPSIDLP